MSELQTSDSQRNIKKDHLFCRWGSDNHIFKQIQEALVTPPLLVLNFSIHSKLSGKGVKNGDFGAPPRNSGPIGIG